MASTFPLLRLPSKALETVLKNLKFDELIFLSILSKRSKRLVKSINWKDVEIEVDLLSGFFISIGLPHESSFKVINNNGADDFCKLAVHKFSIPTGVELTKPGFGVRQWMTHFMCIFHLQSIDIHFVSREKWIFSLESIGKFLKGLRIGTLNVGDIHENVCEVLKIFPVMHFLRLGTNNENLDKEFSKEDLYLMKKILIGNIDIIKLRPAFPFDIDTLLMMNSTEINSGGPLISERELNIFIKLWLKGSNPNLKLLRLRYLDIDRILDEEVIMNGIQHERKPDEEERRYRAEHQKPDDSFFFFGGYDFYKSDGSLVTVLVEGALFALCVWPRQ